MLTLRGLEQVRACAIAFVLASCAARGALAEEYKAGNLVIAQPWSRATPGGAMVAAGYLGITNTGSEPDRLLEGTSPVAGRVEVHEASTTNGVARMHPVDGGLEIRSGETVEFKPGGRFHLMLQDLHRPLKVNDRVPATLTFAKAGAVEIALTVEAIGAGRPASAEIHNH